jgi:DNA-binding transcriptional LysR family regulator
MPLKEALGWTFRALDVVVTIAEHGTVTHAAAALHLSSSAVSHTLVTLERELGVDLFHRLPRGMALTDAGEAFVAAARRALHEAEVARRSVDAVRGLVAGHLNVAAISGCSVDLADLIGDFADHYPEVLLRVFPPESPDVVLDLVRTGTCELGFTWLSAVPDDLQATPAFVDPAVLVVPECHRLAGETSIDLSSLHGERIVASLVTSTMRPLFDNMFRSHGVEPNVVAEAATNEMTLELVRAGVGCTVTFASSVRPVLGRGVVTVAIVDDPGTTIQLVSRLRQEPTPAARAFGELVAKRFAGDARASTFFE